MDASLKYAQALSNFNSGYNVTTHEIHENILKQTGGSHSSRCRWYGRPSSPLFHRTVSPPEHVPLPIRTNAKFNFDLYKPDDFDVRPISPARIADIEPDYLTSFRRASISSENSAVSKLRQINDELYATLIQTDTYSCAPLVTNETQYHIHHYPLSRGPQATYRTTPRDNLKPRISYRIHSSRRQNIDPVTIDFYPEKDPTNNEGSWTVRGRRIREKPVSMDNKFPYSTHNKRLSSDSHRDHGLNHELEPRFQSIASQTEQLSNEIKVSHIDEATSTSFISSMSDRCKTERQRNSRDTGSPRIRASTPTVADSNKAQVSTDTGIEVPKSIDQHKTDEQEIHELVHGEPESKQENPSDTPRDDMVEASVGKRTPSPRNDDDQNDQEVAAAFNFNKWLQETSKQIEIDPAQDINETASSESSVPDEELYNPPFGPRKTNHINVPEPMKNETNNDDVDDFFS